MDISFACILLPEQYRCIWLVTTSTPYRSAGSFLEPAPYPPDGASVGSRGPPGYGAYYKNRGKTEEISGGEQDTTNLRMEVTAACVALETWYTKGTS